MASVRAHIRIDASVDNVWKTVSDAGNLADWMSAVSSSRSEGTARIVVIAGGPEVTEEIVTNDPELHRLQYAVTAGLPLTSHLSTVDVLPDGEGALVVWGADVAPDKFAAMRAGGFKGALADLKTFAEARG